MAIDREAPYAALLERLRESLSEVVVTLSDKTRHWADVEPMDQPAVFLALSDQTPVNVIGVPPRWILQADLYVYVHSDPDNQADIPRVTLNRIIAAIEAALEWRAADGAGAGQHRGEERHQTTLGGLVQYAWVSEAQIMEGVALGQSAAILSIEMLTAA
jgi:hypothetical protein